MIERTPDQARRFLSDGRFIWHQRFELASGVFSPGISDVLKLLKVAEVPSDVSGASVLDVGTNNGGACFELERRGASRVVGADIAPVRRFGFEDTKEFLGSNAEYLRCSVYDLPGVLQETFDIVIFWGVIYHLRHPLLAIDALWEIARDLLLVESAISDFQLDASESLVRFFRGAEFADDASNWFLPTSTALLSWLRSSGFDATLLSRWPQASPGRCMITARRVAGRTEFEQLIEKTKEETGEPIVRLRGA